MDPVLILILVLAALAIAGAAVLLLWLVPLRRTRPGQLEPTARGEDERDAELGDDEAAEAAEPLAPPPETPAGPWLVGLRPDVPVVLVHGLLGFNHIDLLGRRWMYFRGVVEALRAQGITVYVPRLPPLASVPARAEVLSRFVESLPHPRMALVAHSMGGLDARYALTQHQIAARVGSLVTVATPHHGTPLADISAAAPMRALRGMIGRVGLETEAIDWLTTRRLERFNRDVPDLPGVLYGSIIGRSLCRQARANPMLLSGHMYLSLRNGPNDGMVPADSQRWGELLDEVDADHWAQIGWSTYFDAGSMYLRLYETLKRRGL